jgi:hypothetical protein
MRKEEFSVGKATQLPKLRKESRTPALLPIVPHATPVLVHVVPLLICLLQVQYSSLNASGGIADPVDVEACVEDPAARRDAL